MEARDLFEAAGPSVPVDPKMREILAPARVSIGKARDADRSSEFAWLRTQSGPYRGQWVALIGADLVASAPTLRDLRDQLAVRSLPGVPLIHHIE